MRLRSVLFVIVLVLPLASAHADEVFVASLSGARVGSPATGAATFTLRADLSAIDYVVTYDNLSSPEYMAHVHRADDTVLIFLPLGTPKIGTWEAPSAQDIAELRNEELYVNVHSEYYPTGEIRGTLRRQALPAAVTTWGAIKALYR
ncbi:MAG TPA: CHRD domain-containing protein [Candidatus Krumholzibacteria bacterium]|nr:CHRD domain-containing protein [Candidatus Krumholzibacteria bacterium]